MACKTRRLDDNDNIHGSAICGHDVYLSARATIGMNAQIGERGGFGTDLTVGPDAQIGEGVICGNSVSIGQAACIGNGALFRDRNEVPAYGRAYKDDDTKRTVIEGAKDGYIYRLVGGNCKLQRE